jgi:predicted peptidase
VQFRFFLCLALLPVSLAPTPCSAARTKETGFLDRALSLHGATYKYQVFVPEDWNAKRKWPIILFLHGAGERGSDGLLQTDVGLPHAIRQDRSRFPTIVVIPQCLKDHWWTEPQMEEIALASLAAATKEFQGDAKRTYLTGLSMGGSGSWDLAARYPGKFAAIVPICGRVLPEDKAPAQSPDDNSPYVEVAKKIGNTPVWIFHGGDDPVVPVSESRHMAEAMRAVLGQATVYTEPHRAAGKLPEVIYTEYSGVAHNSWDKAYAEPNLIPWLLSWSLLKKGETMP